MNTLPRVYGVIAAVVMLAAVPACGKLKTTPTSTPMPKKPAQELKYLAMGYNNYAGAHQGQGPASPDEWLKWSKEPAERALIELTRPGGPYVFKWNLKVNDISMGVGSDQILLAYESKVPTQGGVVVTELGSARMATPAEFNDMEQFLQKRIKETSK